MGKRGNPNWKPGQTGNPNGRPTKDKTLTKLMDAAGDQLEKIKLPDGTEKELTRKQILVELIWRNVWKWNEELGRYLLDIALMHTIFNRMDGLPVATHELSGKDGQPISLRFSTALDDEDLNDGYNEADESGADPKA